MDERTELEPEIAATLRRYLAIQAEEQRLHEEKTALQDTLARHMARMQRTQWYPDVDGQPLKVRATENTVVEYDEAVLRERLGDRYSAVLAPDIRKLKRALPEIAPLLSSALDRIGTPAPDRVRAAIDQGLVRKEEFAGAFRKTTRRSVAVARVRQDERGSGAEPDGEPL